MVYVGIIIASFQAEVYDSQIWYLQLINCIRKKLEMPFNLNKLTKKVSFKLSVLAILNLGNVKMLILINQIM